MKKSIHFASILLAATLFTSCSNDDENYPEQHKLLNTVIENDGESLLSFGYSRGLSVFADNNSFYEFIYEEDSYNIIGAIDTERGVEISYNTPFENVTSMVINDGLKEITKDYDFNQYTSEKEARLRIMENGEDKGAIFYHWSVEDQLTIQYLFNDGTRTMYYVRLDNKKNPFWAFWDSYKIDFNVDLTSYTDMPFFLKHNPVLIIKDDVLIMQANYIYDEDGYPIECNYRTQAGTGTINYFYN
ncbi:hypothetical protein [Robertkochia flava]|uniref:hypothetical protein n=1 Tax=Robertkochia flava TaxID=3447986 RepID=UPI001CCE3CDB|nr:hypothetical protein [Robertkochia marina]